MTRHTFFTAMAGLCSVMGIVQAAPSGIVLVQQIHTVWGDAGYPPVVNTYFESGEGTVTGSASGIGAFGFPGMATSTAGPDGLSAFRLGDAVSANAYAQSTYVFTPDHSLLVLDVSGVIGEWSFENKADITLTDLTTATLVDSFASTSWPDPTMQGFEFSFQRNLPVDPTHVYELIGFVEAHRAEGGSGSAEMAIGFYSIPVPSAIVLGGFGAAAVGWLRRRKVL